MLGYSALEKRLKDSLSVLRRYAVELRYQNGTVIFNKGHDFDVCFVDVQVKMLPKKRRKVIISFSSTYVSKRTKCFFLSEKELSGEELDFDSSYQIHRFFSERLTSMSAMYCC